MTHVMNHAELIYKSVSSEKSFNTARSTEATPPSTISDVSKQYIQAATSDNTRKAYQSDVLHFINWGGALPTDINTLLKYLHEHAETHNHRTLSRRLTAIKNWHLYQGFSDPTSHPLIRKTLTGIKNTHGKPRDKAPALTVENLRSIIQTLNPENDLMDCRNNALVQIGYFGAFRRSELVAIQWEHIQFSKQGIEILIPKSKTDQSGEGQVCAIPYGSHELCAVKALQYWQEYSNINTGFIFRRLNKRHKVLEKPIAPNHVNIILKQLAQQAKLQNADDYSSHSLRRGFATEASRKGAPFGAIMRQGRWKSESTVLGYIEAGKRFDENAVDIMLGSNK